MELVEAGADDSRIDGGIVVVGQVTVDERDYTGPGTVEQERRARGLTGRGPGGGLARLNLGLDGAQDDANRADSNRTQLIEVSRWLKRKEGVLLPADSATSGSKQPVGALRKRRMTEVPPPAQISSCSLTADELSQHVRRARSKSVRVVLPEVEPEGEEQASTSSSIARV